MEPIPQHILDLEIASLTPALLSSSRRTARLALGTRCRRYPWRLRDVLDRGSYYTVGRIAPADINLILAAARAHPREQAPLPLQPSLGEVRAWCRDRRIDDVSARSLRDTHLDELARIFVPGSSHDDLEHIAAGEASGNPREAEHARRWALAQLRIEAACRNLDDVRAAPLEVADAFAPTLARLGPIVPLARFARPLDVSTKLERTARVIGARASTAVGSDEAPSAAMLIELRSPDRPTRASQPNARDAASAPTTRRDLLAGAHAAIAELLTDPSDDERRELLEMLQPRHELLFAALSSWSASGPDQLNDGPRAGLWWRVSLRGGAPGKPGFAVEPSERVRMKKGKGLTRGRIVDAMKAMRVPGAQSHDVEAAELLGRGLCPLPALVGAANVIDELGAPIAVERAPFSIAVVEGADGFTLVPRLAGAPFEQMLAWQAPFYAEGSDVLAGYFVEEHRIVVARLGNDQLRLLQLVSEAEPVPRAEAERLIAVLEHVAARVPIELPAVLEGETSDAPRAVLVRLSAVGNDGVQVRIGVRPALGGAVIDPGAGSEILGGIVDGKRVRFRRVLELELQDADAVRARIWPDGTAGNAESNAEIGAEPWRLTLTGEEALLLLERVEDARLASLASLAAMAAVAARLDVEAAPDLVRVTRPMLPRGASLRASRFDELLAIEGELVDEHGTRVDLTAALAALRSGGRFVKVSERHYARISDDLAARLRSIADITTGSEPGAPLAIPYELAFALEALRELGADVSGDELWQGLRARVALGRDVDGTPSPAVRAQLRPYQEEGVRFLRRLAAWGVGGVLADDMGLGKTLQAIALLVDRCADGPQLVVAPTSVAFNWQRELERFAPSLRAVPYAGASGERTAVLGKLGNNDVVIISYALLVRDIETLANTRFATLVLDEAHAVKNPVTQRARAVRKIDAAWRFGLSGTPLENNTSELWSLFSALAPGLLGSRSGFRERFAGPIEADDDVQRRRALARVVRPFLLRRKKSEVALDLPPRTELTLLVEPSDHERAFYRTLRDGVLEWMNSPSAERAPGDSNNDRRFRALAALTKLRVAACAPVLAGGPRSETTSKATALLERLEELRAGGHKALVFSQFVKHLDVVQAIAERAGFTALRLDGNTRTDERERVVDRFQRGEVDCMFLSVKAGGVGLNLTRASYVFHLDPWWNPAVEEQATGRAHRIGQSEPVVAIRLVARGTIEEAILRIHADKRSLVDGVLEGSEAAATLSYDELRALLLMGDDVEATKENRARRSKGSKVH